ncbi:unnamed protein product [Periconia digitata]|uniref:Uncharacterized protein n=1 Tax=Periconia digitata TaxID=1303443 RepID=A0A9W4XS64_9PLEO|nr:unnamed protein product [Periconia digitata]
MRPLLLSNPPVRPPVNESRIHDQPMIPGAPASLVAQEPCYLGWFLFDCSNTSSMN